MKTSFKIIAIILIFNAQNSMSQNNMYIITEKVYSVPNGVSIDSVFVTTPNGVTTASAIPFIKTNTKGHDQQFSTILNSVLSQGYKIIHTGDWAAIEIISNATPGGTLYNQGNIRTMFLAQP